VNAPLIAAVATLVLLAMMAMSYNRFISQRHFIRNTWANVDTELKRRYDLIPNLVETVKGYASHEQRTLEEVIQARSGAMSDHGTPEHQAGTENVLVGALRSLFAVAEAYPDLKADERFGDLQRELVRTEDRIQAARRLYNNNVRDYNRRVEAIPTNLVAALFGFRHEPYFEIDSAMREAGAPAVDLDR
jgi:LemA protein